MATKKREEPAAEPAPEVRHKGPINILIQRFPGEHTVMGPAVVVRPLDSMVDSLFKSGFMESWIKEQIEKHLLDGHEFACPGGRDGGPKNIYRLCTDRDMQKLAAEGALSAAVGTSTYVDDATGATKRVAGSRKSRAAYRVVRPGKQDKSQVEALQRQGKIILEIMRQHVGPEGGVVTAQELRLLLESKRAEIKTGQDVMKLFGFHMSQFYKKSEPAPLVEYLEDEEGEDDAETE
jgi:hypothetical protein